MMKKLLMVAALAVAPAAMADLNYNFFDLNYTRFEDSAGNSTNDPSLFLSKELADQVNFRFGYGQMDTIDTITLGLGYNQSISDATDLVVTADLIRLSDVIEIAYFNFDVGVRSAVSDSVELEGALIYGIGLFGADAFSDTFGFSAGARFNLSEQFALGFGYKDFDDISQMTATVRFSF